MASLFWSDVKTDPKRRFRFELGFTNRTNNDQIPVWTIKTAMKPKANVSTIEHQYIDHVFKYPGRVTWDPITVTLVDPVEPDLCWAFLDVLGFAGYKYPTTSTQAKFSLSKERFAATLGSVFIRQIDDEGKEIEKWELVNPFITSVDFGGALDYAADDMNEVTVEVTYDWARLTYTQQHRMAPTAAASNV
ncbi:MAG TPA: hypothetical protein DEQ32_16530 [Gammaproteobacteria bacterium]|nr:hypothetical protein [Gammaproteobacteria bacterium]|tara:strand:- start:159 stop:728 length:570 start_codon:yes stop_codon:yes gene_type:complete